ncbi:MAG TPA: YqgE/AlgH family protein [Candidatus Phocaeicola gallistercoris]|nr:YqgE/AlgH family protein [Candidatus Phocaeicola gallistercoris]
MDMRIFQVKSNKHLLHVGSILIASPLLTDYHFSRSVVLIIAHNEEGSMGIVMNKNFRYHFFLNELFPQLASVPLIPIYKGGPVERDTIFFVHTLAQLEGSVSLGNGIYVNGNFEALLQYIKDGNPIEGYIRFFSGYAGWSEMQLEKEIEDDSWMIGETNKQHLFEENYRLLWGNSMKNLGDPYQLWAKYPRYPLFN